MDIILNGEIVMDFKHERSAVVQVLVDKLFKRVVYLVTLIAVHFIEELELIVILLIGLIVLITV